MTGIEWGLPWLSQSHSMFIMKPSRVDLFQHLSDYKTANQVKLTNYNKNAPIVNQTD